MQISALKFCILAAFVPSSVCFLALAQTPAPVTREAPFYSDAEYRILLRNGKAVKANPTGTKTVAGAIDMIMKANFASFFPVGADTSLVRVGYVNCHQSVCEFMLQQ